MEVGLPLQGFVMIQVVKYKNDKAKHDTGKGQNIETEMAELAGQKVFWYYQPVNRQKKGVELLSYVVNDLVDVI